MQEGKHVGETEVKGLGHCLQFSVIFTVHILLSGQFRIIEIPAASYTLLVTLFIVDPL